MIDVLNNIVGEKILLQIIIIISSLIILLFLKNQIILFLTGISKKTATDLDDIIFDSIKKPTTYLILISGLILIYHILQQNYNYLFAISLSQIFYILFILIISWILVRILDNYQSSKSYLKNLKDDDDPKIISQTYEITLRIFKIILIVITILIVMQEFGLSVTGILAFGGVGGLVVGLAAKDLLSNFFGGLMIFFDRPFRVGEFIKSPDRNIEGIVEKIGWRLTVVRTFSKNVLYIPNSAFSSIIVENATRMTNRRINEIIGLRYDDIDKIPKIVDEVRLYLSHHKDIDQENKPLVYFKSFSASSCDFFVYAFTITKEWRDFLRIKEDILYKISEIINQNDASIAFPTTTIDWKQDINK